MTSSADSRVAIVTGGARSIGAATARRLAADGLAVAFLDLDETGAKATADSLAAAGARARGVPVGQRVQVGQREPAARRVARDPRTSPCHSRAT
jgi:3-oxoacyl-[acyl-carrier protein] reductase